MIRQATAFILGLGALMVATSHAFGQGTANCAERARVVARLAETYGETRRALGLAADATVLDLYASERAGTRTIRVGMARGASFEPVGAAPAPSGMEP